MSEAKLRRTIRAERKRARLGKQARCAVCGEDDIRVLQRSGGKTLCASCRLAAQGKDPYEKHHPAGRWNDPFTVEVSANEHAVFSDMQEDWSLKTRRNPGRSVLREQAAWLRAAHDIYARASEVSEEKALVLEELDEFLSLTLEESWPRDFDQWRKGRRNA